jgi:hypothetical protein
LTAGDSTPRVSFEGAAMLIMFILRGHDFGGTSFDLSDWQADEPRVSRDR